MFDEPGFPREPDLDEFATTLCTFVYCSRAADDVDEFEVRRIVEAAQRRNRSLGITGVLVFGSGIFFQWIEGSVAQMQDLIARLYGDPRHYDVVALEQSEERRERIYLDWDMEQVEPSNIREVLKDALGSAKDENNVAALRRILEHLDAGSLETLGRS